jgi:hypothetical protein
MDNKTLIEKDLGPEAKLTLEYKDGQIVLSVDHKGTLGGAGAHVTVEAAMLVDAITDVIPGNWDDALLDDMAKKLLAKKTGA